LWDRLTNPRPISRSACWQHSKRPERRQRRFRLPRCGARQTNLRRIDNPPTARHRFDSGSCDQPGSQPHFRVYGRPVRRLGRRSCLKGGCSQDWLPHKLKERREESRRSNQLRLYSFRNTVAYSKHSAPSRSRLRYLVYLVGDSERHNHRTRYVGGRFSCDDSHSRRPVHCRPRDCAVAVQRQTHGSQGGRVATAD
jgi:hypothetical protein